MTTTSLRDSTYAALRSRIVGLHHAPGERLIERDLAAELQVSRIPLREAMQRLQQDGLVVIVPRQGAIVAPFTADDVRDLFDVRESLEVLAARLAAARATPEGLARMRDQMDAARDATRRHDEAAIAAANAAFHHELVDLAANPLLTDMMRPLEARVEWLFHLTRRRDPVRQCEEHEAMFEAIARGDVTQAERQAFEHVRSGRAESIELAAAWATTEIDPVAATRSRRR